MRKILWVLGFILLPLLVWVVAEYLQEGWVGIITCFSGYLLIAAGFCGMGIWLERENEESLTIMTLSAALFLLAGMLFFLWPLLLLLSDLSQGRQSITTERYTFHSYYQPRHIGSYRLVLPEVDFSADINAATYQRLKMDCDKPITVEYYPRSGFVLSVKIHANGTAVAPSRK